MCLKSINIMYLVIVGFSITQSIKNNDVNILSEYDNALQSNQPYEARYSSESDVNNRLIQTSGTGCQSQLMCRRFRLQQYY